MTERFLGQYYKDLCKVNNQVIILEESERWPMYGSCIESYEDTFIWAGDNLIKVFLHERKKLNKISYAIDLASDTAALRDLAEEGLINGGIAIGLSDIRPPEVRVLDNNLKLEMIKGDLLRRSAWHKLRNNMEHIGSRDGGADLVVCRQGAGFLQIPTKLQNVLIRRMVNILNPGGQLLVQTHSYQVEEDIAKHVSAGLKNKKVSQYHFSYGKGLYLRLAG